MGETARLRAEQIRQEIECAACDSHQSIGLRMSDEIKCEACDGAGVQVVKQPSQSGKRIYLPLCKLCGGKGRVEIRDPNKRQ
jgi:DnaJ-class molecular chaperone